MVERRDDVIAIRNSEEDLKEVLADLGLPADAWIDDPATFKAELARLGDSLHALRDHPSNEAEASLSAVIGNYHFPLRKTLYLALVTTVKASAAVIAITANPLVGGLAMTALILDTVEKVQAVITRLDDVQILVLGALGTAIAQNRQRDPTLQAASVPEVLAVLTGRGDPLPDVATILARMADPEDRKGVRRIGSGPEARYAVIF